MSPALIRTASLMLPVLALIGLYLWRRGHRRRTVGALLASAWAFPALVAVNLLAQRAGCWSFEAEGGLLAGLPVDLILGWSLIWGAIPALLCLRTPLWMLMLGLLWLDLLVMPLCQPVVQLGPNWLLADLLALLVVAGPALCLARWVRDDRFLKARVSLGMVAFGAWIFGLMPLLMFEWRVDLGRVFGPAWVGDFSHIRLTGLDGLWLQCVVIAMTPGLAAVREFVERGGGTPLPYDPPKRMVRTGVYSYLSNPMQSSMALALLLWAVALRSPLFASAAVICVAYCEGLARWHEGQELTQRYGRAWSEYQAGVRRWWPRLRPFWSARPAARLYFAGGCGPCESVARWLQALGPSNLDFVEAQRHPARDLWRLTYDPMDGSQESQGVAAFARALEHVNGLWAAAAWMLLCPGILTLSQWVIDGVGGEPQLCPREGVTGATDVDADRSSGCPKP